MRFGSVSSVLIVSAVFLVSQEEKLKVDEIP